MSAIAGQATAALADARQDARYQGQDGACDANVPRGTDLLAELIAAVQGDARATRRRNARP